MAVTLLSATGDSPEITLLNVARLFTRLEHNVLSPGSQLRTLHKSEPQRLRVAKNVEYARTLLSQLERSLPQIKPLDRRHEAQAEIARDRQLLKRLQTVLDEEEARGEDEENEQDEDDASEIEDEWKDLFTTPIVAEVTDLQSIKPQTVPAAIEESQSHQTPSTTTSSPRISTTTTTSTSSPTAATITPQPPTTATSTLRNRNPIQTKSTPEASHCTKASGSSITTASTNSTLPAKEEALSAARLEQEDLTTSLLSLASQLKASSQSFQATLENEKSVLDRAVAGIDKTSSTMEAAGQRMGMLRRMTEGKGWWGRMMLYAWIFGLWVVAVLIVFVGPKLRF